MQINSTPNLSNLREPKIEKDNFQDYENFSTL